MADVTIIILGVVAAFAIVVVIAIIAFAWALGRPQ